MSPAQRMHQKLTTLIGTEKDEAMSGLNPVIFTLLETARSLCQQQSEQGVAYAVTLESEPPSDDLGDSLYLSGDTFGNQIDGAMSDEEWRRSWDAGEED